MNNSRSIFEQFCASFPECRLFPSHCTGEMALFHKRDQAQKPTLVTRPFFHSLQSYVDAYLDYSKCVTRIMDTATDIQVTVAHTATNDMYRNEMRYVHHVIDSKYSRKSIPIICLSYFECLFYLQCQTPLPCCGALFSYTHSRASRITTHKSSRLLPRHTCTDQWPQFAFGCIAPCHVRVERTQSAHATADQHPA